MQLMQLGVAFLNSSNSIPDHALSSLSLSLLSSISHWLFYFGLTIIALSHAMPTYLLETVPSDICSHSTTVANFPLLTKINLSFIIIIKMTMWIDLGSSLALSAFSRLIRIHFQNPDSKT